jgi:hypothetical protein
VVEIDLMGVEAYEHLPQINKIRAPYTDHSVLFLGWRKRVSIVSLAIVK